jgi:IMP and pyridine-specific 5'-nucleotidase
MSFLSWPVCETKVEKYEYRLSGLLHYFQKRGLTSEECERFYLFGGECNYLLRLHSDFRLHPVSERGPGGWMTATQHLNECPANWESNDVEELLDAAQSEVEQSLEELNLRGRVVRKYRSVGLVPRLGHEITRESLDETVLRVKEKLAHLNDGKGPKLPYCAFNGGSDAWVDAGNKRVGVQVLQSYLGIDTVETLHIGTRPFLICCIFFG